VFTAPSPDREADDPNQDALTVVTMPNLVLMAVADGLGGHRGGHEASKLLVQELDQAVRAADEGDHTRTAVLGCLERVDAALSSDPAAGATTVVVIEVNREGIRPYHVGDAGALITGQRGRLKLRTMDHSPVGYAVAAGLLDVDDALHHDERHVVSNAVGGENMRVELGSRMRLGPRDTIVLGSDGLFDNLTVDELSDIIRIGPLTAAAERLVTICRQRMTDPQEGTPSKMDDLSFILYRSK
jgi:serine/threonine protein phosphatase PrpC